MKNNLDEIIKEKVIHYDFGIPDYKFSTYKKHISDLGKIIDDNKESSGAYVKARAIARATAGWWCRGVV